MKTKILITALILSFIIPFVTGMPKAEAGHSGRTTTAALVTGLVGGIVGGMVTSNFNRPCTRCYAEPVYVGPTYVYEQPVVYVPQRQVVQEVRYYPAPVYQTAYTYYR